MRFVSILLALELVFILAIILWRSYAEVDWLTYMEQVRKFVEGELDYSELYGDTGPLVYPGGFAWVYTALYFITDAGSNIILAQWIFMVVYMLTLSMTLGLYERSGIPWRVMLPLFLSKRIRSVFVLRLFGDCWTVLFVYAAISFIAWRRQWLVGCLCFSIAVSLKMSAILFAPGLLYVMLRCLPLNRVVLYLSVCALWQVIVGLPFLLHNPAAYVSGAFNFKHAFGQEVSINFQNINTSVFYSPIFAYSLLGCTAGSWILLWRLRWSKMSYLTPMEARLVRPVIPDGLQRPQLASSLASYAEVGDKADALSEAEEQAVFAQVVLTLFESNMVGVIFAKSLHFQFFSWFFFSVPYILHYTTLPHILRIGAFALIRQSFDSPFPTPLSSTLLQIGFAVTFIGMLFFSKDAGASATPSHSEGPGSRRHRRRGQRSVGEGVKSD